ncbi:MAG: 2-haloacid dehalogenase [Solirubrobacteraceae bacterium]|nr:2-haloacid dehalogenase [Solirubrobacteraceae bacterium]
MAQRPIIVFDVNETLLNLETLCPTFERIFNDPAAMRLWFADLILYSEALTLAGVYVPFTDIGGARAAHAGRDPPHRDQRRRQRRAH